MKVSIGPSIIEHLFFMHSAYHSTAAPTIAQRKENMDEIQDMAVETNNDTAEDDDLFDFSDLLDESDKPADEEEETNDESDVEDSEEAEEKTEEAEESDKEDSDPSDSEEEQDQPDFLKIKFNKEEISLSKKQAIEAAQKGMNYDKVYEGYQSYQSAGPLIQEINRLAEVNGMTPEEFMLNLSETQSQIEINKEIEALREQYPNSDDSLLEELAKAHVKENSAKKTEKLKNDENVRRAEIDRQIGIFEKRYPNEDVTKLDPEVYSLMKDGCTLLEAYEITMSSKQAEKEKAKASREKISKKNEENKKKSIGRTDSGGTTNSDLEMMSKELFSD